MNDRTVRAALERHCDASDASDFTVEQEIYRGDAVLHYRQSGERIHGRQNDPAGNGTAEVVQRSETTQCAKCTMNTFADGR